MDTITIQQAVTWGIPTLAAIIGATFALTKYSNANAMRALEDRLKLKDDKLRDFETQLHFPQKSERDDAHARAVYLPMQAAASQISDPEATELAKRIEDLEHQRELLLSELSTRATASLDPRSELSNLLSQLQSSDNAVRRKAIEGLIVLKDPLSFPALMNFLMSNSDEATSGNNPRINQWFSVLIETGGPKGAEFVVSQIEGTDPSWSEAAFSAIRYDLDTPELIDGAMPSLESVALRHSSTATRTKAKMLIQHLETKKKKYEEREAERRHLEQLCEGSQQMREEQSRDRIPSDFIIVSALKDNGLSCLARKILHSGQDLQFWRSGAMVAEEFIRAPDKRDNCMRAIQQIIDTADGIAKPSHVFLLSLLSQMKTESSAVSEGEYYLSSARELSPSVAEFLAQHERAFGIQSFAP